MSGKKTTDIETKLKCPFCNGTGYLSRLEKLRKIRQDKNITLRELSLVLKIKPSRLSELETGLLGAVPTSEELAIIEKWIENQ